MRRWLHVHKDSPQAIDVLGWTQHGAIVLATEAGWLPVDEPVFVRMDELELVGSEGKPRGWWAVHPDDAANFTPEALEAKTTGVQEGMAL